MFALPIPVLLILTIVTSWGKMVLGGYYAKRVEDPARYRWLFGALQSVACGIAIAVLLSVSGGLGTVSLTTVLLGFGLGLGNIICLVAGIAAMERGPFSYTTVITSMSTVITALSGMFFGESVSLWQFVGIALMVVCLFLSPERAEGEKKQASFLWLVLSLISMLGSGTVGMMQKLHQSSPARSEMAAMLLVAFSVSAIFSFVMAVTDGKKRQDKKVEKQALPRAVWSTAIISGLIFSVPHTVNLFLAGVMPAVVMFPLVNLCPMLMGMVTGIVMFRERLSPLRWLGVALGVVSTVLVSGVLG